MLTKLVIENYALVEKVAIDFRPGLTILTGETGAGKSVIINGLLLALGGRADRELIRHGSSKAVVSALFSLPSASPVLKEIKTRYPSNPDSSLELKREISVSGSSRAYINGKSASLGEIKTFASHLCDLNTQQGQRKLLDVDKHILFLDSYAGLSEKIRVLQKQYYAFTDAEEKLRNARDNADAFREKLELIRFQIEELSGAEIREGEEQELDVERKRLQSIRQLSETGQRIVQAITESDNAIISVLSEIDKELQRAGQIDEALKEDADILSESVINLNELSQNIQSYLSRLEDNPHRLDEIEERLSELYRLKKKYQTDEAGLLEKLDCLRQESLDGEDMEAVIKKLTEQLAEARQAYFDLAIDISAKRKKAAKTLEKKLKKELADLAIPHAEIKIDFQTEWDDNGFEVNNEKTKPFPHGLENIEFLISTNPNEPLRPLTKIASGGEISRIMLALLTVIAGKYRFPTIVFDEIDTGIGGKTAIKLGQKLRQLSKKHQIITISHLPAVATQANCHLVVDKHEKDGRNVITVREIKGSEVKRELIRMTAYDK